MEQMFADVAEIEDVTRSSVPTTRAAKLRFHAVTPRAKRIACATVYLPEDIDFTRVRYR